MSIVSLVIAPTLAKIHESSIEKNRELKMKNLKILNDAAALKSDEGSGTWLFENSNPANKTSTDENINNLTGMLKADDRVNAPAYSAQNCKNLLYVK